MNERLTITVREAADQLGVSTRLVYDLVQRGEIRALRLGRRVVIPRTAVRELLEAAS